jgi:hypothetical protein
MVYMARQSQDAFIKFEIQRGETLMKSTLIRVLTIATLATSISAFAATDEPKHNDAVTTSASNRQDGCAGVGHKEKKQKNAKPQRDEQRQNDKDFDLGIYG